MKSRRALERAFNATVNTVRKANETLGLIPIIVVDLFCGAGGASQGLLRALELAGLTPEALAEHGFYLRLININHWEIAIDTIKRNIAFAEMYNATIENWSPEELLQGQRPHLLIAAPECFAAGTLVLTDRGNLPIEEIVIGDRVLTHLGRWRKVTNVLQKTAATVIVRGSGHYGLETTADHRFWTRSKLRTWNNARRAYDYHFTNADFVRVEDFSANETFWATPRSFEALPIPAVPGRRITQEDSFWWMVGRWLGDGSLTFRRRSADVTISCGKHEADELEARLRTVRLVDGTPLNFRRRNVRTATLFNVMHVGLGRWLLKHFGKGAAGKRISGWALGMPEASRRALLAGYLSADGHFEQPHRTWRGQGISKALILGVKMLAEGLGKHATFSHYTNVNTVIEGRRVNAKPQFATMWYENQTHYRDTTDDELHVFHRVRSITPGQANAPVYDIEVEDDHSFVADGIVVHNCITYSKARGKRPIKDQSRTTAAWVIDWVKTQPHALYFENVSEWRTWSPLNDKMEPIVERLGEYFDAFVAEIRDLGYSNFAYDDFVCAEYGDATTRERLFALAWHDEYKLSPSFPAATHTKFPERFPHLQRYRDARSCIDFTRPSNFITERETIHAPATLRRIGAGFAKQDTFDRPMLTEIINRMVPIAAEAHERLSARPTEGKLGRKPTREERQNNELILSDVRAVTRQRLRETCSKPLAVFDPADVPESIKVAIGTLVGQHPGNGPRQVSEPLMTIEAKGAIGLADPFLCKNNASEKSSFDDHTQSLNKPYSTIVAKDCRALAEPSLVVVRHGEDDIRTPNANDPLGTLTTKNELGLAQPTILHLYSSNIVDNVAADRGASEVSEPVSTISAGGNHHALAQPVIQHLYGGSVETGGSLPDQPMPTIMTVNHHALAEPFVTKVYGERRPDEQRNLDLSDPLSTISAGGNHHGLAEPTLIPQHFDAEPQSPNDPLPTVVAIARIGLAEPTIVSNHHQNVPFPTTEPLGTATTATGGGMFLAEPAIIPRHNGARGKERRARPINEPLPTATGEGAGSLAQPFLTPNFGEREKQSPRNHAIDAPVPAVTSHGAGMLVDISFSEGIPPNTIMPFFLIGTHVIAINIRYRMLHSSELAAAHSLDHVNFSGTETDAIRQIGNSIPARTAAAFITHALRPIFARLELPMRQAA